MKFKRFNNFKLTSQIIKIINRGIKSSGIIIKEVRVRIKKIVKRLNQRI